MAMKSQDDWTASSFLACFPTELFGAFWRDIISKSSADIAKAVDALVEPKICRAALGRNVALLKAVKLRHVADTYKYLFSNELKPPE